MLLKVTIRNFFYEFLPILTPPLTDRAAFFSAWRKTGIFEIYKSIEYTQYEVDVTDPKFREIIPTILKYMPNILAEEPPELVEKLKETLANYQNIINA